VQRAGRLSFTALAQRAERADRMIKGRVPGDAWDELALLATDICATPVLPQAALPRTVAR
jgi:hypothetical protein